MKTMKKIASIILTLLLMVGMVSVNGTTNAYASEPDNFNTVENPYQKWKMRVLRKK